MNIIEVPALVALHRVTDLVVVSIFEVVPGGRIHCPGAGAPAFTSVGKTQELVIRAIRTDTLNILYGIALIKEGQCMHIHRSA